MSSTIITTKPEIAEKVWIIDTLYLNYLRYSNIDNLCNRRTDNRETIMALYNPATDRMKFIVADKIIRFMKEENRIYSPYTMEEMTISDVDRLVRGWQSFHYAIYGEKYAEDLTVISRNIVSYFILNEAELYRGFIAKNNTTVFIPYGFTEYKGKTYIDLAFHRNIITIPFDTFLSLIEKSRLGSGGVCDRLSSETNRYIEYSIGLKEKYDKLYLMYGIHRELDKQTIESIEAIDKLEAKRTKCLAIGVNEKGKLGKYSISQFSGYSVCNLVNLEEEFSLMGGSLSPIIISGKKENIRLEYKPGLIFVRDQYDDYEQFHRITITTPYNCILGINNYVLPLQEKNLLLSYELPENIRSISVDISESDSNLGARYQIPIKPRVGDRFERLEVVELFSTADYEDIAIDILDDWRKKYAPQAKLLLDNKFVHVR